MTSQRKWQFDFDLRRAWCLMPLVLLLVVFGIAEVVRPAAGLFSKAYRAEVSWVTECPEKPVGGDSILMREPKGSVEAFGPDLNGRIRWAAAGGVSIALALITLLASALIVARQFGAVVKHPVRIVLVALAGLILVTTLAMFGGTKIATPVLQAIGIICVLVAIGGHAAKHRVGFIASVVLLLATAGWIITGLPLEAWTTGQVPGGRYGAFALTTPFFDGLQDALFRLSIGGWPRLDRAIGGVSVFVVVTLALAVCALASDCSRNPRGEEGQLRDSAESMRLLQYLGAGVLVAGVVYVKMLHDWPVALVCGANTVAVLTDFSNHWSTILATYWTLMLVAIFVPAHITLARAARQLARSELTGKETPVSEKVVDEWLEAHGLKASPAKQVTQLVAILSPWLTSVPLAGLVEILKQGFS